MVQEEGDLEKDYNSTTVITTLCHKNQSIISLPMMLAPAGIENNNTSTLADC